MPIYAVQHIRRMRGGSQAHLLRASDGCFYVTKFKNNPQHVRVLANEFFGSRLGVHLGLPTPQAEMIEVSEWLIENTPDLCLELADNRIPCSPGLNLGCRYCCDPQEGAVFDYLPESLLSKVQNRSDLVRILVLDKWLGNCDGRQVVFSAKSRAGSYVATFIDQGYCCNAGEWNFPDSPLRGVYSRNDVYSGVTGWDDFEPTLSRVETIDATDLWRIAEQIPREWCGGSYSDLEKLVEEVYRRRTKVRELISSFRDSSRHPFPNWTQSASVAVLDSVVQNAARSGIPGPLR
jgi:hypothetical protein